MHVAGFVRCNPRFVVALPLATTMLVTVACGGALNSPSAPDVSAGCGIRPASASDASVVVGGQTTISICHRTEGTNEFILISVAEPVVAAHIAHGDGRVGEPVPGLPGMKFGPDCTPVPLIPVTITFSGLAGNGSPFTTYHESGFTVSPTSSNWEVLMTYGQPAPSIIFRRLAAEPAITAEVQITGGGSVFSFNSVDLYSSITPIPYTITGLINSKPVFAVSDTVPNTFGNFATVLNPNATDVIDTLLIRLSNPATPCCSNPVGLDNVVVRH